MSYDLNALQEQLNKQLKEQNSYEDWMAFSVTPLGRGFNIGFVMPSSHGISTEQSLSQVMDTYRSVMDGVLVN